MEPGLKGCRKVHQPRRGREIGRTRSWHLLVWGWHPGEWGWHLRVWVPVWDGIPWLFRV